MNNDNPIDRRSWEEFRETGLLWFVNRLLHLFGWCIVVDLDKETETVVYEAYPARTLFRGFSRDREDQGFRKVSRWLETNICDLVKEANEEPTELYAKPVPKRNVTKPEEHVEPPVCEEYREGKRPT